ncbi:GTP 3',8-cyclase MoaA [Granulicella sp. 5B5]|uniref:GTP 3',8-cyclase MoaA n=1 Tax=Granulicella sp. 5B5 TaxID=1617967 RepID=UPI0015F6537E|nr:GTP 3',8-cyclase MoaA [Granulicella sp. 5B5]QMV18940.1 GTP 3',8-cyclase MoaA [Granulicella sp. 5B5]
MGLTLPILETAPPTEIAGEERLRDSHGRYITDLRLSVTDRCNYRCVYCRTGNDGAQYSELPLEEYARLLRIFVSLGIEKIRLTGGEPLLRAGLLDLIRETATLRSPFTTEPLDIALTTNGHLLAPMAQDLKDAGLSRITISMDAVDAETFARITRVPGSFERVQAGIRAAQKAGLGPIKINCVLLRGFNEGQIEAFAEFSRREGVIVRFIEFMPLEEDRTWTPETVVPMAEIVARLNNVRPLVALPPNNPSETARRFTFDDGLGEIGIIAPVSQPFCGHCSRVRLTSDGKVRTCLFSQFDHDLIGPMRRGANDVELRSRIRSMIERKEARHHIGEPEFLKPSRSMVHIGG